MQIGKAMAHVDLQVRKPAGWLVRECHGIPDHEDLIVPFAVDALRPSAFWLPWSSAPMSAALLMVPVPDLAGVKI